jgi:hypothetical protein
MASMTYSRTRLRDKRPQLRQRLSQTVTEDSETVAGQRNGASVRSKKGTRTHYGTIGPEKSATVPGAYGNGEKCCHFWTIESADGPYSNGWCKWCGQEKQFSNYLRLSSALPEKDAPRLSYDRYIPHSDTDTMLQKQSSGYLLPSAGVRRRRKAWTYPRRTGSWVAE